VKLAIAEAVDGAKLPRCENIECSVLNTITFFRFVGPLPAVEVGSVEKNDCVRWRKALEIAAARFDLRRLRSCLVVNLPLRTGNQRRIGVTGRIFRRKQSGSGKKYKNGKENSWECFHGLICF